LGGEGWDEGYGIAVDGEGNVVVTGETNSAGWVSGGYNLGPTGATAAFAVKLSPSGNHLWSTYLGGSADDWGYAVAVDGDGSVLITGETVSANWVSGGYDTSYGGDTDAFVAKLSSAGDHLWSSYLGDTHIDFGAGVATDDDGHVYVAGTTFSPDWVSGGYDTTLDEGGGSFWAGDGFVVKLNPNGNHLWSTYLGGSSWDEGVDVATDAAGNVFVTGTTDSPDWVSGGYDTTHNGGGGDAFVAELGPSGNHRWSSYLGGTRYDDGTGVAVDGEGNVLVTGETSSEGWVYGGYDESFNYWGNGFLAKLSGVGQPTNHPPTIGSCSADPAKVTRLETVTISAEGVVDIDGTVLQLAFYDNETLLGSDSDGSDGWSINVSVANWELGDHVVTAKAQDDSGETNEWSEPVSVTITVINRAPTIQGLSADPDHVTRLGTITLTAEDVADADGTVQHVEFRYETVLLGRDTNGNDGWSISISMAGWEHGQHTFSAQAQDDSGASNSWSDRVSATITVIDLAPTVQGDDYAAAENEPLAVDGTEGVLANDEDADDRTLIAELVDSTRHGELVLNEDGSFVYTPDLNFNREDWFQYRTSNGLDVSDAVTVTIAMETAFPWYNGITPLNVNDNGQIAPLDALLIINELNRNGIHLLSLDKPRPLQEPFYDVNRDGWVTPYDALLVINHLNREGITTAEGESEAAKSTFLRTTANFLPGSRKVGGTPSEVEDTPQSHLRQELSSDIPTGLPLGVLDHLRVCMDQNENWTDEDLEEILEEIAAGGDGSADL
jgi:VCBS repeat-containing protein